MKDRNSSVNFLAFFLLILSHLTSYILASPFGMASLSARSPDRRGLRVLVTGTNDGGVLTGHSYNPKTRQFAHLWTTSDSSPSPSWQYYIPSSQLIYSVNMGSQQRGGSIDVYKVLDGGFGGLEKIANASCLFAPVSIDVWGELLVTASYAGSGVNSYTIDLHPHQQSKQTPIALQQNLTYTLPPPGHGPNLSRQDAPHPHQADFDPTGQFLIVPDLGADLLRLYTVDHKEKKIISFTDENAFGPNAPGNLKVKGGFGPRHGAFWPPFAEGNIHHADIEIHPRRAKYLYLLGELMSEIIAFSVTYEKAANGKEIIKFEELQTVSTFGKPENIPKNQTFAAEVVISSDGKFLYASNRFDRSFKPDPEDEKKDMDSIVAFSIDSETGLLTFIQLTPSGGSCPRHFAINELGSSSEGNEVEEQDEVERFDYITVPNQLSDNLVIYRRCKKTGFVGAEIWAQVDVNGGVGHTPTCVTWL